MAIIKFSSDFLRGSVASLQGFVVNINNQSLDLYGTNLGASFPFLSAGGTYNTQTANMGYFRIMSGTIPTNIETLSTSTPPVGTTVLWQLSASRPSAVASILPTTGNNWYTDPTVISTTFTPTIATGVASWFWIFTGQGNWFYQIYPDPTPIYHNVIGTIGTVGSGEDMEMLNTSIVSGQYLRIINFNLKMPTGLF